MIYVINGKIKRFEIFSPKTTLKAWYDKQADKPDICCNASLYSSATKPIGTIYDNGKLINNAGGGFGIGTKDGVNVSFGSPWAEWKDYITGYYGLIQNGTPCEPTWEDKYVFDKALNRIAIGQLNSGAIAIYTADTKTIKAFRDVGFQNGFTNLVNLDGGGSRALCYMGKWIYTSTRTPYNAIAIWLEKEEGEHGLKAKCIAKTQVFDSKGQTETGRYISKGDVCQIGGITEKLLIEVTYPVTAGTRTAYVKSLSNFIPE